jgi:hypothetical protein
MSRPKGNRLSLAERLQKRLATGALPARNALGAHLHVRQTAHGLGLFAACCFAKGEEVAHMTGVLHEGDSWPPDWDGEVFHVRSPTAALPGRWVLLNKASAAELANFANTAGRRRNNARLSVSTRTLRVTLRAMRPITAGEEVLASYGAAYTKALVMKPAPVTPPPPRGGWVACPACSKAVRSQTLLAIHRQQFGCRR